MQPIGRGVINPPTSHSPCPILWNETKHSMSKQHVWITHSASLLSSWFLNWVCLRLTLIPSTITINYFLLLWTTCSSLTGWKCPQTLVYHSAIEAYRGWILNMKLNNILLPEDNNNNSNDPFIPYPGPVQAIDVDKLAILAVNLLPYSIPSMY